MSDRKDLLQIIDDQKQQLQRYERRLRDIVTAYKSLTKEKEALEASLKALTPASQNVHCTTSTSTTSVSGPPPGADMQSDEESKSSSADNDKVATLTRALATLTEEKSRLESHFQADKKLLLQEKAALENDLQAEKIEGKKFRQQTNGLVAELKNKLRSQQIEREKEQNNHAIMLRELQSLVGVERNGKEQLENKLEGLQRLLEKRDSTQDKCEEYRQQIKDLSNELRAVRGRLKVAEERAAQPQPLLLQLQQEMADLKMQNHEAVLREQCRANEAEDRLQQTASLSEVRVASLEARLSELSEVVGSYDRLRQQDQQSIHRLKERVAQLDIENTALMRAAGSHDPSGQPDDEDQNLDVHGLVQKIINLKGFLKVANCRSKNPINLEEFLQNEGFCAKLEDKSSKEELLALKEEFEQYKAWAQSVLRSKNANAGGDSSEEVEILKVSLAGLRTRVRNLTKELEEQQVQHQNKVRETEEELANARRRSTQELAKQELDFQSKVSYLEGQMQKQRTRTVSLVADKDAEIKMLKTSLGIRSPSWESSDEPRENPDMGEAVCIELSHAVALGHQEGYYLHYVDEMAKKDAEISHLRKGNHHLEATIRDMQLKLAVEDDRHSGELDNLKETIGYLERNRSREGANLEYLKNVVLSYVLSSDVKSRQHMLNAIATLLKFSPNEVQSVKQHYASWWSAVASTK